MFLAEACTMCGMSDDGETTWILRDCAIGAKLLQWSLIVPNFREDEDVPIHVPHGCDWSLTLVQLSLTVRRDCETLKVKGCHRGVIVSRGII